MSVAMHEVRLESNLINRPRLHIVAPFMAPTARENWVAQTVELILAILDIDLLSATKAVTLAADWLQDYSITKDSYESMEWSREFGAMILRRGRDPKGAMMASYERVASKSTPDSVRLAAIYAFCEGLDEPIFDVWTLLTTEEA